MARSTARTFPKRDTALPTRTRRGRPPLLSRAQILDAARRIPAHELTMPGLALALGVPVSSLYRHVASRDDVLAALAREIIAAIVLPKADPRRWRRWLRTAATHFRRIYIDNPVILNVEDWRLLSGIGTPSLEPLLETLEDAGFDTARALQIAAGINALAYYSAATLYYMQPRSGRDVYRAEYLRAVTAIDPATAPRLVKAASVGLAMDFDEVFSANLDWLIAGIPEP